MERIPQEVVLFHVLAYLSQFEVVCGVSETSKYFCDLIRGEFGVVVETRPFEELSSSVVGWRRIEGVKCRPTEWGLRSVRYEEFAADLERGDDGCFTLQKLKDLLGSFSNSFSCSFAQYDVQRLQILPLKMLELTSIHVRPSDLVIIQAISTLEVLSFEECQFGYVLDAFPPKLKILRVFSSSIWMGEAQIKNLPKTLKSFDADNIVVSPGTEPQLIFPSDLQHLNLCFRFCGWDLGENLPFNFPSGLKTLDISSLFKIQGFSCLAELNELESLVLCDCVQLRRVPLLPSSLRKLGLHNCNEIQSIMVPPHLEELECQDCPNLEILLSSLPQMLVKLKILSCQKIGNARDISLAPHLKELSLSEFENVESLPDLPQVLHSLTLRNFGRLKCLPVLPGSLRKLELGYLRCLEELPSLPKGLKFQSLQGCPKLKCLNPVPPSLKELAIWGRGSGVSSFNVNGLPDTLIRLTIRKSLTLTCFPDHLDHLEMQNTPGIESLSSFPGSLKSLKLVLLKDLKEIPLLPQSLREFSMQQCDSIQSLPTLPLHLRLLKIARCNQIESIGLEIGPSSGRKGELPISLRAIDIKDCEKLRVIGELPFKLKSLTLSGLSESMLLHFPLPAHLEHVRMY